MNAAETPIEDAPSVAIRTRPPSPRRLSRKVLLAGAMIGAAIVTAALLFGLSPQPPRMAAEAEAQGGASAPPETIADAASLYEPGNFAVDEDLTELAAPEDPLWANPPPAPRIQTGAASGPALSAPAAPDPETAARVAPILFASGAANAGAAGARAGQDARLDAQLVPPRSRYEIQAGAVIPAALVTALNSDLPGRVIAQVTAPVYDSITGDHLLIPQGSRLIGAYESGVRYGDARILLVWNRLILPNGWSIDLGDMPASDPTGAAGLADRVDNHFGRLASAIGLSAIVSVIANQSEDEGGGDNASLSQSVGEAAAQQAAQTGSQIVQRDLSVRPTLRIRPGASVRVLIMRDIELRQYR